MAWPSLSPSTLRHDVFFAGLMMMMSRRVRRPLPLHHGPSVSLQLRSFGARGALCTDGIVKAIAIMQSTITLRHGRAAMPAFPRPLVSRFLSGWGEIKEPPRPPSVPPRHKGRSLKPGRKMAADATAMGGARRATVVHWCVVPRRDMAWPLALHVNAQARCFYFYGEPKPSI